MTLIQLLIYAALSSQAKGDSARMAAQMPPPAATLDVAETVCSYSAGRWHCYEVEHA